MVEGAREGERDSTVQGNAIRPPLLLLQVLAMDHYVSGTASEAYGGNQAPPGEGQIDGVCSRAL